MKDKTVLCQHKSAASKTPFEQNTKRAAGKVLPGTARIVSIKMPKGK